MVGPEVWLVPTVGSLAMRGVPPVVVGPEVTPPVERDAQPVEELLGVEEVDVVPGETVLLLLF
jgi:hypothetical protein